MTDFSKCPECNGEKFFNLHAAGELCAPGCPLECVSCHNIYDWWCGEPVPLGPAPPSI